MNKEQFLEFAEEVYLRKIQGEPIREERDGYTLLIQDDEKVEGRFFVQLAGGPLNVTVSTLAVTKIGLLRQAGFLYDRLHGEEFLLKKESLYEEFFMMEAGDLPSLAMKKVPFDPSAVWLSPARGFLAEARKVTAKIEADMEVLEAAKKRLDEFKAWKYEMYREAVHTDQVMAQRRHATDLFVLETGARPDAEPVLLNRFQSFLFDSVVQKDAESMPKFQQETDCGG